METVSTRGKHMWIYLKPRCGKDFPHYGKNPDAIKKKNGQMKTFCVNKTSQILKISTYTL